MNDAELDDKIDRLRERLERLATLLGLLDCDDCNGSGESDYETTDGTRGRCNCFACHGVGFKRKED